MKLKNMLLATGIALLAASCSSEDGLGDGTGQHPGTPGRELRLVFGGSGESADYTRSIASESENKIERLDIYVFAAANGSADYQYLETWTSADKDILADRKFVLQGAGTSRKASIFPTELKGVPNLRLYCVANAPTLYQASGMAITPMTAIQTDDVTGSITRKGTLASEFEAYLTVTMQSAAAAGNPLQTPLVMTGSGDTRILGNIATVNIELKRRVARFDVDNDASKTGLIIESIALGNGRTNTTLMPSTLPIIPDADRKTKLIEYPASGDFKLLPLANQGVTPSALYTYPADKTDRAFLIIKGKYQNPMQPQPVPVTYNLDITKLDANGQKPEFIDVKANTRYTLRIQEVMEATITAFFEIVDWTSGGGVIIKPDNAAPEVIGLNKEGTDVDVTTKEIGVTADGTQKIITLTATASGRVIPDMTAIEGWADDWLSFDDTAYDATTNPDGTEFEVKDGVPTTTLRFTYTLTDGDVYSPVTVTLKNTSASADESVYTKLNILPPAVAPAIAFKAPAAATGNFNSYTQTAGPPIADRKITLYKASKSNIVLGASCPFGTTVENRLAWLAVEKSATAPTTRAALAPQDVTLTTPVAEYYTFTLKDVNAKSDADSKIKLINAQDNMKFAEVTVELLSPDVTNIAVAEPTGPALASGAKLDGNNKITGVSRMGGRSFTITLTSPEGMTSSTLASWYTVADNNDFNPTTGEQTFTVSVRNDVGDFTPAPIIFKNKIQGADDYIVTVEAVAAPAFAAPGNVTFTNAAAGDVQNAYDDGGKTLTLATGATNVKLAMDCYYGTTLVNNCSWLTISNEATEEKEDTKTTTYTLTVAPAGTAGSEGILVFKNSKKPDQQTTITVKLVDPTAAP